MPRRIESHWIAGPAGRLEALLEEPEGGAPLLAALVCHPHPLFGGSMHNKVVHRLARGLRRAGAVALRFNFRGVSRSQGRCADVEGGIEDARAALAWLRGRYPDLPFALAGFSFGARVVTRLGCDAGGAGVVARLGCDAGGAGEADRPGCYADGARFLLAAGFPTTMGGAEYLEACPSPKIFVSSTHDEFAPRPELEALFARMAEPKRLHWVEAADHFFAGALDEVEEIVWREGREYAML